MFKQLTFIFAILAIAKTSVRFIRAPVNQDTTIVDNEIAELKTILKDLANNNTTKMDERVLHLAQGLESISMVLSKNNSCTAESKTVYDDMQTALNLSKNTDANRAELLDQLTVVAELLNKMRTKCDWTINYSLAQVQDQKVCDPEIAELTDILNDVAHNQTDKISDRVLHLAQGLESISMVLSMNKSCTKESKTVYDDMQNALKLANDSNLDQTSLVDQLTDVLKLLNKMRNTCDWTIPHKSLASVKQSAPVGDVIASITEILNDLAQNVDQTTIEGKISLLAQNISGLDMLLSINKSCKDQATTMVNETEKIQEKTKNFDKTDLTDSLTDLLKT